MMKNLSLILLAAALLAGCTENDNRITFDDKLFRTKASKSGEDLADFTVSIAPVSASLEGARAAGEYEGVRYCIANFGTSRIDWSVGPQTAADALLIDGDTMTFVGSCER